MPYKSRWTIDIPKVSLPTYLFTSPTAPLSDKPVFISTADPEKHQLSFSAFRLYAQRLASGLQRAGLKPGDRVLLYSGNTLFFPVVILGIIMAGGIFTGANPGYVARELAYQLQDSGSKFLICADSSLSTGLEAAKQVGMGLDRIFVFDDGLATSQGRGMDSQTDSGTVRHWTYLLDSESKGKNLAWEDLRTEEELNRTVVLNYSSGTTGVPKGVEITHRNYVSNSAQAAHMTLSNGKERVSKMRWLCFVPLYHAMGQTTFTVIAPKLDIPVYMMSKFDFLGVLDAIQRFRITDLILVPPVVVAMAKHSQTRATDLSSVLRVASGAAPLGKEVTVEFEKLWEDGRVNVKQGWGMTEATCMITSFHAGYKSTGGVGELAPNCEAKVVADEAGQQEVERGKRGELWVRAPNVMKGYWNKPEATRETLTEDGWLKTGDIAHVGKDNIIFIVDRKKELIKVKGNQVAPAELEALLLDHPAVTDAAVIGVTLDGDELPRAYIVPTAGQKAGEKEIQEWLAKKVSKHKRLAGGVRFTDAIPKNPSGKILRKVLRDQAKAEVGDSDPRPSRL